MRSAVAALSLTYFLLGVVSSDAKCTSQLVRPGSEGVSAGHLVYEDRDDADNSALHLYDFTSDTRLDPNWEEIGITQARNSSFSPDGHWIVFSAVHNNTKWSLFAWNPSLGNPIELTGSLKFRRSEDAKFSLYRFQGEWRYLACGRHSRGPKRTPWQKLQVDEGRKYQGVLSRGVGSISISGQRLRSLLEGRRQRRASSAALCSGT